MINDKVAKMAVNTLKKYCNTSLKTCNKCAVKDACSMSRQVFGNMDKINDVGTFEDWQKPAKKPPKFDITLKNSAGFRKYINEIFLREAEKYGLPMNPASSIKWSENGKIKVTFVDDNMTNYIGVAKCHPDDAFNPEIGIKLAIERAAQAMHAPFVPAEGETYYYVDDENLVYSTINHNTNKDALNIAVGNCFKKHKQAQANVDAIMQRIEKSTKLLEKLRDQGDE
jgi:hypothetical protein|nr:MAG TPA: hypothetical protein [Caudoviricetes sp.]